jgi:hypothetical protein
MLRLLRGASAADKKTLTEPYSVIVVDTIKPTF